MPDLFPEVGDTALHVSSTMLDASAMVTATRGFELGARYSYAAYAWSSQTATGTTPVPSRTGLMGFGPEFHGAVGFGPHREFMLGFAGNLLVYRMPTASWARSDNCTPGPNCYTVPGPSGSSAPVRYELRDESRSDQVVMNVGIFASELIPGGKYGHLFAQLNLQNGFKNVGFSDRADAALKGAGLIPLFGVGYGVALSGFRASALVSYAFTGSDSPVNYGFPTFVLTIGGDIPLWHE